MKQLLLSTFQILFLVASVHSQHVDLRGTITSSGNKALPSAHVLDVNSRKATVADDKGRFQLAVADSGTVLRVSHVGFRPVLYTVTADMLADGYAIPNVKIVLDQASTMLSMAIVSASDQTVIDGQRGVVLRDFSFADGNNLLLMAENGIRYLMLCDEDWKEVTRVQVDEKGYRLYEDCLGNVHLFGKDSVYQIQVSDNRLSLIAATEQSYFMDQMAHCSTSSDSHIFFSSYQKAGQEMYHYGLNKQTKDGVILQRVFDHLGLQDIQDYFADLPHRRQFNRRFRQAGSSFENERLLAMRDQSCWANGINSNAMASMNGCFDPLTTYRYRQLIRRPASSIGVNAVGISGSSSYRSEGQYFQSVSNRNLEQQAMLQPWSPSPRDRGWIDMLSQPTYSPMFNLRDSIFIFDHAIGVCYVHNSEGELIRSFPTEHQELKGWRNVLVADANGERLYAHLKRGNEVYLTELSLDDGSILKASVIPSAKFVEHLKVKNGKAFFLKEYRDIYTSDRMLSQRL